MSHPRSTHRCNYNIPGHAHVLTFSCYHGFQFLGAERTCEWLAEAINAARSTLDFSLWAYVFMPEHVHLIVYPQGALYDIADIRHEIKQPVGEKAVRFLANEAPDWIERITRTRGKKTERHFWQSGGGYDRNIDAPKTLAAEIEYIHMNPVRRSLVQRAQDWKWSSAGWYLGLATSPLIPDSIPPEWVA